jgi:hypothetical protein
MVVRATLRDTSTCQVRLGSNDILLPYSDIHRGHWDDTFSIGSRASMDKYVGLYIKLKQRAYANLFPHPESLLRYHLQKAKLNIVDACGAARGDILDLDKQCGGPSARASRYGPCPTDTGPNRRQPPPSYRSDGNIDASCT